MSHVIDCAFIVCDLNQSCSMIIVFVRLQLSSHCALPCHQPQRNYKMHEHKNVYSYTTPVEYHGQLYQLSS